MTFFFTKNQSSALARATAVAAAFLVLALVVFAASPTLHAWLHSREAGLISAVASTGDHASAGQAIPGDEHDDNCAVALFSHGIPAAIGAYLLGRHFGKIVRYSFFGVASISRTPPRYWLPPLCGPPLN